MGLARSNREAPIHFWPQFTARFRASPHAHAGPTAAAGKDEGVGLPDKLSITQHDGILLPDPRHAAHCILSAHAQLKHAKFHPRRHAAHAGSRSKVTAGRGAFC